MASIVEKYEQILAADPRSRIFVELAKALVERGEHARAAEVCRKGLEHHPSSVLGRVTWGRALLEAGDVDAARAQFRLAIGLDPNSPYAFNLVGESLVQKGLWSDAAPIVARAAELQPADARVKGWLDEVRRNVGAAAPSELAPPPPQDEDERTDADRRIGAASAAEREDEDSGGSVEVPIVVDGSEAGPAGGAGGEPDEPLAGAPEGAFASPPPDVTVGAAPQPQVPARATPPPQMPSGATPPPMPLGPRPPPVRRPPPVDREVSARFTLSMIPGATRDDLPAVGRAGAAPPTPAPDAAEAARIAAEYEKDLRAKLMAAPEPPPHPVRKHRRAVAIGAVLVAIAGAASVTLVMRAHSRAQEAAHAGEWARAALARDTLSALQKAAEALSRARHTLPDDRALAAAHAEVLAVLASDHGDESARIAAKALLDPAIAGDGALVARLLLAEAPPDRKAAEADVLAAPPSSDPVVQALAGEILLARGDTEGGRKRLDNAARAAPPLLRALADLGDAAVAAGDPEGALAYYTAALGAQPTHPRSVVGAAEARLALDRELETSRRELRAVDEDPGSAPPEAVRPRFEIAYARVLAALGDPSAGAARLARAQDRLGRSAALSGAAAEIQLAARAYDRAEAEASRAVALAPKDPAWRVLLARARIGRGQFADALAATGTADTRAIHVQRAIARHGLGQFREAKAELEKTAHDGKMPAEAAVWYALCDLGLGKADKAEGLLEKLVAAKAPPAIALVALGRVQETRGKLDDAEKSYRAAVERDGASPEANAALGRLLLARDHANDAIPLLERAAKADPFAVDARLALGEARLAAGSPAAARAELDAILLQRPKDARALRALSAAYLAEKQAGEARRAAERAATADGKNPASWIAVARAALASGDATAAREAAGRAVKLAGKGPQAAEARKLLSATVARR